MDRLSKENKRDACPMDSRPNYANKCLIASLSARLVQNLHSRIYISKGRPSHKGLMRGGF